jgi:hypothetical protein
VKWPACPLIAVAHSLLGEEGREALDRVIKQGGRPQRLGVETNSYIYAPASRLTNATYGGIIGHAGDGAGLPGQNGRDRVSQMSIPLLPVGSENLLHDEVQLIGVATRFVFQGLEGGGGEGALARQKEAAVFGGEEVVELGLHEAELRLALGSKGALPDLEAGDSLGLESHFDQFLVGQGFQGAFEGGGGDVGGATEGIVANGTRALPAGEVLEAEVNHLFGGTEVGKYRAQQFREVHCRCIAWPPRAAKVDLLTRSEEFFFGCLALSGPGRSA